MTHNKLVTYVPVQVAEAKLLMRSLLLKPEKFMDHLRQYAANVILKSKSGPTLGSRSRLTADAIVAYGFDSEDGNQGVVSIHVLR